MKKSGDKIDFTNDINLFFSDQVDSNRVAKFVWCEDDILLEHLDRSLAFLTSDDFIRSNEITRTNGLFIM